MTKPLRIIMAQLNLMVGDIQHNLEKHLRAAMTARDELQADIIVFPELSLTGYPPEDLLLRPSFLKSANDALHSFIENTHDIYCVISHPHQTSQGLFNNCSMIYNGSILGQYSKQHLPNYGVFDESRYFNKGSTPCVIPVNGIPVGLVICEDLWLPGSTRQAVEHGAKIILSPNASPFESNKHEERLAVLSKRAKANHVPIVYVNCVGGQDEITFDGGSMAVDANGDLCQHAGFFNETLHPVVIDLEHKPIMETAKVEIPSENERIYRSLVLALRDYVAKNHFKGVLLGLSGGIDSALTLAIAVDALGANQVKTVFMPSRYTSQMSQEEALQTAANFNVACETISIEPAYQAFLSTLSEQLKDKSPDVTEENIQSRCRAVILMALSNKTGYLVLPTGNRSELAVGYCTIYGDMAGGFGVLKDVPKTLVYELARYYNHKQGKDMIPERTITRAPTAELAENQTDQDTLPPYAMLDNILHAYLNLSESVDNIVAMGFPRETVNQVIKLIHRNEYKRSQSAIGPRINQKSFGKDWRYPITNGYKR